MSFPVAGTLMIEPTESEDLTELDRFCEAMIAIRQEIDRVGSRRLRPRTTTRCKNAPHTAETLLAAEWKHPYERAEAAYPVAVRPGGPSTGRRSAGSTRPTATATWSAPARRRRRSSKPQGYHQ